MNLLLLFNIFFKIGLFTFGGGYAMIPLIKEYVTKYSLISNDTLLEFIAISESTPGPFAINISTFVGFKNSSFLGSIVSTLGVTLPSFLIILLIAKFMKNLKDNPYVSDTLKNIRPVILSLLIYSVITIALKIFFDTGHINIRNSLIFLLIFLINLRFKLSPIMIILLSGVLGIIFL